MKPGKKLHGFVAWSGPSELDGQPIVLVATRGSRGGENRKTGAIVQTYILRADVSPVEATKTGEDFSVCGDCIHRKAKHGTCYVRVENGPLIVWKGLQIGRYPYISQGQATKELSGDTVRLGAYGDPAAVPFGAWANILRFSADHTGYTHQWKDKRFASLRRYCMASCDTEAEYQQARADKWRAFYVVPKGYKAKPDAAFLCPASEEAGKKLTCTDCRACSGTSGKATASVFIPVHGVAYKQTRFSNLIQIGG